MGTSTGPALRQLPGPQTPCVPEASVWLPQAALPLLLGGGALCALSALPEATAPEASAVAGEKLFPPPVLLKSS